MWDSATGLGDHFEAREGLEHAFREPGALTNGNEDVHILERVDKLSLRGQRFAEGD
jgi:hypothetical protein